MGICRLCYNVRVLYSDLAECMVRIWEASIGYNLSQHTLESRLLDFLGLLRCWKVSFAIFVTFSSFTTFTTTALYILGIFGFFI